MSTGSSNSNNKNAQFEVVASVIAYSLCSGTLVLLNKLTLHHLPYPSLVVCIQLLFTLLFIGIGKATGMLQVDPIRMKFVIPYLFYIILFRLVLVACPFVSPSPIEFVSSTLCSQIISFIFCFQFGCLL